ncbi:RNA polymerase sigma-70 factor [Myroides odoratimimus]|uniref:RNA polymerase sigma-70 factor n=1 Tax=Myroides odoratimimus TaxID=76832 RepID=UPI002575D831|nr:RNA polymerase sigma-70 factor [Myroides odoratimimus]MDM1415725.1 RNA polymerase sigma-70 factor [Myroides odoratimimus]MDM1448365.1 RNA polymerase sigma-70 factor [Myroides odoratimimus]MEC4009200.1 RNA polymerase sigma-70 factor [Myroides odoratimimus]
MQDSILLQAIKNDNKRAFKKAFETYYKPLCIYIKSFTKDLDTAEEIVQSTFIYFWNKRHDIEIHTSLKSYLYMMCYNNYLQSLRQQAKQDLLLSRLQKESLLELESEPEENLTANIDRLHAIIETLPSRCQEIIKCRLKGLKYQEIADKLNISIKTVESQMAIAYTKIRENFNNNPSI